MYKRQLHNRVESIDQCAAKIKQRIPEAEIAGAHGKMNEEQLGDVMQAMSNGEVQILVCTTDVYKRQGSIIDVPEKLNFEISFNDPDRTDSIAKVELVDEQPRI